MRHFRNQGMSGLFGFNHSFIERCTTCSTLTITSGVNRGTVGSHTRYGESKVPIFRCPLCRRRYSARHATALWDVRINEKDYCRIAKALAEGVGIRTTARIFDVDKDTGIASRNSMSICRFHLDASSTPRRMPNG